MDTENIINQFHKLFYDSKVWLGQTLWQGVPVYKCPLDLWMYQEIIYQLKPDLIIELGTADGGSALYLANILDLINKGEIVTVDIQSAENKPQHHRIKYLTGSSISVPILESIASLVKGKDTVMVILDSLHSMDHVLMELQLYNQFVTVGSYLILEDTNINGHPVLPEFGPGPMEALNVFLTGRNDFIIDKSCEKLFVTFFPNGFLKKVQ